MESVGSMLQYKLYPTHFHFHRLSGKILISASKLLTFSTYHNIYLTRLIPDWMLACCVFENICPRDGMLQSWSKMNSWLCKHMYKLKSITPSYMEYRPNHRSFYQFNKPYLHGYRPNRLGRSSLDVLEVLTVHYLLDKWDSYSGLDGFNIT